MVKKAPKQANPRRFVGVLVAIALGGVALLAFVLTRPAAKAITVDPTIPAGTAEGILMGRADAPVTVIEFADFECPGCAQFATVTEPDIRTRLVATGTVAFYFFDFPLSQHRNTWAAHLAAACANDQGKFWEMHDRIFAGQDEWNGEATTNPRRVLKRYAGELGLDVATWEACLDSQTHAPRIKANMEEGSRRRIGGTPTFVIGNKMVSMVGYDEFKRLVDEALAESAKADASKKKSARAGAKKGTT